MTLTDSYLNYLKDRRGAYEFLEFVERKSNFFKEEVYVMLSLISASISVGLYKKAYDLCVSIADSPERFEKLSKSYQRKLLLNMEFCKRPFPWSSGHLRDYKKIGYLHYKWLDRYRKADISFTTKLDRAEFQMYSHGLVTH